MLLPAARALKLFAPATKPGQHTEYLGMRVQQRAFNWLPAKHKKCDDDLAPMTFTNITSHLPTQNLQLSAGNKTADEI